MDEPKETVTLPAVITEAHAEKFLELFAAVEDTPQRTAVESVQTLLDLLREACA